MERIMKLHLPVSQVIQQHNMHDNIFSLPENIQFYITCNRGFDIREQLYDDYNINDLNKLKPIIEALEDFYLMKINAHELMESFKLIPMEEDKLKKFTIDFLGRFLLVFDDDYNNEISGILKELNINPDAYKDYVIKLKNDWNEYKTKLIDEGSISQYDDDEINIQKEKKDILSQLESDLSALLLLDSEEGNLSIQCANWIMGYVLFQQPELKETFIKALTDNQTDLTDAIFLDNEKGGEVVTVSSWLADYLSFSGNRFNDNLMAARYIIESPRVKKLSDDDKLRVKNLIALYRNIYNFPNNFDYNQPENTQFFPIDVLKIRYGKLEELIKPEKKLPEKQDLKDSKSEKPVLEENKTSNDVKQETPLTKASKRYQFVFSSLNLGSDLSSAQQTLANKTLDEIITSWRQSFSGNDKILLIASLAELFKRPNYSITWFNTPEIREVLSSQVVAYPSLAEPVNREGVVANIVIAVVTKAILQRLGFSDEQAAIIYLQIAGHEPKLASFVFFDAKLNKFSWRKFIDE